MIMLVDYVKCKRCKNSLYVKVDEGKCPVCGKHELEAIAQEVAYDEDVTMMKKQGFVVF